MNLRSIEILFAILDSGSITRAADLLGISQPAVTKALRRAEDELGFRMFDRVKGRLVPTKEARLLYPELQRLHDEVGRLDRTAAEVRHGRVGQLSLASIPTLGETVLPGAVARFLADRPDVHVSFLARPRRQVVDLVASHAVDLGFAFFAPGHTNIETEVIGRSDLVCIVPGGHPLAAREVLCVEDLAPEKFVWFARDQGLRPLIEGMFAQAGVEPPHNVEVGLISSAWAMVAAGVGVSIVDGLSRLEAMHPSVAVRPVRPRVSVAAEVLWPRYLPRSRLAEAFVAVLKDVLAGGSGHEFRL